MRREIYVGLFGSSLWFFFLSTYKCHTLLRSPISFFLNEQNLDWPNNNSQIQHPGSLPRRTPSLWPIPCSLLRALVQNRKIHLWALVWLPVNCMILIRTLLGTSHCCCQSGGRSRWSAGVHQNMVFCKMPQSLHTWPSKREPPLPKATGSLEATVALSSLWSSNLMFSSSRKWGNEGASRVASSLVVRPVLEWRKMGRGSRWRTPKAGGEL